MLKELMYDAVFDAQEHFRVLLDCMARPGTVRTLPVTSLNPPPGLQPSAALAGFALLNPDVSFYALPPWEDYLRENTDAVITDASTADFLFISGEGVAAAAIAQARTGTPAYPEGGATAVVSVARLDAGATASPEAPAGPALALTLTGPGIEYEHKLYVEGLAVAIMEALRAQNSEFPLGIDLILADAGGRIAAIPRSTRVRW